MDESLFAKKRLPLEKQHCSNCLAKSEGSAMCMEHGCLLVGWCLDWR